VTCERRSGGEPGALSRHAAPTNERIRSLVFIAALAPDEGETVAEVFYREKPHPEAPQLALDAHGFIWMPHDGFGAAFSQHASPDVLRFLRRHSGR
jgi:hypothetical protein